MKKQKFLFKNAFYILFSLVIIFTFFSSYLYASPFDKVAIGLKFASTSVKEAKFSANGIMLSNGRRDVLLSSDKNFTAKPINSISVSSQTYSSMTQDGILKSKDDFIFTADGENFKSASFSSKYPNFEKNAIGIFDSKNKLILTIPKTSHIFFTPSDFGVFSVFGKKYRGAIKFLNMNSALTVINYIDVEDYLLGVVPKEVSPSWNMESLKAQAVAARSFAYSNAGKFEKYGFNLTDDTRCQAYGGFLAEDPRSTQAVRDTRGIIGYYNGKPAELIYNASSGGKTESAKNIWGADIPYLTAKNDPFSIGNPYDNWNISLKKSEIESYLRTIGKNIGSLKYIKLDEVTKNGYVLKMTFVGTSSSASFSKEQIRSLFNGKVKSLYFTVNSNNQELIISPAFKILDNFIMGKNNNRNVISDKYVINGHGYGHGVGMSQYGAKKLGDLGYNYKQILGFYYQGISLARI